ncbi:MAG: hypothetical protein B6D68_00735 [spirochete symbiont of Stewartia floridana]|nr:MAG: hypothetical protein B6D68_00735 [spirochete symbiont of Stewartia floridana]
MNEAVDRYTKIIADNKAGMHQGIYSVCSAHRNVIRASMKQAMNDDSILLVESTSNQVNQYGGYMGMKPAEFVYYVKRIAKEVNFPSECLLLGGDHLGPNVWRQEDAGAAMDKAHELIRQYIAAGYRKIHLDCSMHLSGDRGNPHKPLADHIVAARAASLCATAEKARQSSHRGAMEPIYVIGTEVPTPGGSRDCEEASLRLTPAAEVRQTITAAYEAFLEQGMEAAWERVNALVVQPGAEFGDDQVFDFDPEKAQELTHALDDIPNLVFEAHSTDFQSAASLKALVRGHFCILKVGPLLTYAWREALFALADIESELLDDRKASRLKQILEEEMLANPAYWEEYYTGDEREQLFKRMYSYSDRSRYYWPVARLQEAVQRLFKNLRRINPPPSIYSQYLPLEYRAWRSGALSLDPEDLAEYHVMEVLKTYAAACGMNKE